VVEAKVQYERARLELELVQGSLLLSRNIDLSQKELERRTGVLLRAVGITDRHLEALTEELRLNYRKGPPLPLSPAPPQSGPLLRQEDYDRAIRLLRETLREADKAKSPTNSP
jgi:hypothetical protein